MHFIISQATQFHVVTRVKKFEGPRNCLLILFSI